MRLWGHPGIGRYIRELVTAIGGVRGYEDFRFFGYEKNLHTLLESAHGAAGEKVTSPIYSAIEQWEMFRRTESMPLLHVPHFNIPVLRKGKLVVTVHDLIYYHDADASKSRFGKPYVEFLFKQIAKKASAILTVSEFTKTDLLSSFPDVSPDKVFVTHEAASPIFRPIADTRDLAALREKHSLRRNFVLFVGSLKAHKNLPVLMQAVEWLRRERQMDLELVIVGRRDMRNHHLWTALQSKTFIRYLGELPDADLVGLYHLAGAFVLPSFREGFGLPVLEAMACGTPVIVSNRASLPEIAGNAGLIFDAARVDELSTLLYNVLSDEDMRKRLSAAGLERVKEFSWKKTAELTLAAYEKALA